MRVAHAAGWGRCLDFPAGTRHTPWVGAMPAGVLIPLSLRDGAHIDVALQGTPAHDQLISLRSIAGDGATRGTNRMAITRLK